MFRKEENLLRQQNKVKPMIHNGNLVVFSINVKWGWVKKSLRVLNSPFH